MNTGNLSNIPGAIHKTPLTYAETEDKVRILAGTVYADHQLDPLLRVVSSLESLQNASNLFDFLVGK